MRIKNFFRKLLPKRLGARKTDAAGKGGISQNPSHWKPITFAVDKGGVFKVLTTVFLVAALLATVHLAQSSKDLRSRAAKGPLGPVFCLGRKMCLDGHCEGDSWEECDQCPKGRAQIVTEVRCGVYKKTDCIHETRKCEN